MPDVGFRTTLSVDDGASNAYVAFPAAVEVAIPKREVGTEDSTPLAQADAFKRFTSKRLIDPGTLKMTCYFSKALYLRLTALHGKLKNWRLTSPDPDDASTEVPLQYDQAGILTVIDEVGLTKEGLMIMKIEIKASGPPTIAASATNNPTMPTQTDP